MKKLIKVIIIVFLLACVVAPIEHFYGDNIYNIFVFAKEPVVQINENTYKTAKDCPELFVEYMQDEGWKFIEQGGSFFFFERDNKKAICEVDFKEFYSEWTVDIYE